MCLTPGGGLFSTILLFPSSCAVLCLVTQLCLTLRPHGLACQAPWSMGSLQARILERVAMPSSRGSSQSKDRAQVSCIAGGFFTSWATREALSPLVCVYNWLTQNQLSTLNSGITSSRKSSLIPRDILCVFHFLVLTLTTHCYNYFPHLTANFLEQWQCHSSLHPSFLGQLLEQIVSLQQCFMDWWMDQWIREVLSGWLY